MLVLSRHIDESIVIGNEKVEIKIVDIRGDKVRIGIIAPPDVAVHRKEVYEQIKGELEAAARARLPSGLDESVGYLRVAPGLPPRAQLYQSPGYLI